MECRLLTFQRNVIKVAHNSFLGFFETYRTLCDLSDQNIFIFSAYTDACTSSCKIVVASKRPLILD